MANVDGTVLFQSLGFLCWGLMGMGICSQPNMIWLHCPEVLVYIHRMAHV
jgi:hypothetical protein